MQGDKSLPYSAIAISSLEWVFPRSQAQGPAGVQPDLDRISLRGDHRSGFSSRPYRTLGEGIGACLARHLQYECRCFDVVGDRDRPRPSASTHHGQGHTGPFTFSGLRLATLDNNSLCQWLPD